MPKPKKQRAHLKKARLQRSVIKQGTSEASQSLSTTLPTPGTVSPATSTLTDPPASASLIDQPLSSDSQPSTDASDSDGDSDPTFDPLEALKNDPDALLEEFVSNWVASLPRDDVYSLSLLLFHILKQDFQLLIYPASKIIAKYLNKNFKTVQKWRGDFVKNNGELPDFLRGRYSRMNTVRNNEQLAEQATQYVRENSFKKGAANLTSHSFCNWVNDELLPNSTLEPGAPRRISVEVARKWLHQMGFKVKRITKGVYYDGHERADVIDHRKLFLNEMATLGFLLASNAPNDKSAAVVKDVKLATNYENTIFWFHDESTFNANDDQTSMWKDDTMQVIKPKGRGAGLMVSDFIEERDGYLALSDDLHKMMSQTEPTLPQSGREIFEYGKNKEGYWNNDLFLEQMQVAIRVAEAKYPPRVFSHVWVFDHSCGHTAYAPDALVASRVNKKPGGKQPAMRDTVWAGKPQKLNMDDGTPKGAAMILEERGINTASLKLEDMRIILNCHDDFKNEKNALHTVLERRGHTAVFLPKFHCELNGIERVWGHAKRYTRAQCDYTFNSLRKTVPEALDSIPVQTVRNYLQRSRNYMFAYLQGSVPGSEMEKVVNKFGKEYKSHRRVGEND